MKLLLTKGVSEASCIQSSFFGQCQGIGTDNCVDANTDTAAVDDAEPRPDSDPDSGLDPCVQVLSTHPPICDCEGCRMASPVVSTPNCLVCITFMIGLFSSDYVREVDGIPCFVENVVKIIREVLVELNVECRGT